MSIYNPAIPTGIVNLDDDYKNIQNNFSQLDTSFGINHFPFSENTVKNGKHTYINMVDNVAIPSGVNVLVANEGTLYTKTTAAITDMFYTPDASLNEYQMTRTDAANFATFATDTNYAPVVATRIGGWTFLPGGLILQYGNMTETAANTAGGTEVIFPIPFTSFLGSVTATRRQNNSSTSYGIISQSLTKFNFTSNGGSNQPFFWVAIGK